MRRGVTPGGPGGGWIGCPPMRTPQPRVYTSLRCSRVQGSALGLSKLL